MKKVRVISVENVDKEMEVLRENDLYTVVVYDAKGRSIFDLTEVRVVGLIHAQLRARDIVGSGIFQNGKYRVEVVKETRNHHRYTQYVVEVEIRDYADGEEVGGSLLDKIRREIPRQEEETENEEIAGLILKEKSITVEEANRIAATWKKIDKPIVIEDSANKIKITKLPKFSDLSNIAISNLLDEVRIELSEGHEVKYRVNGLSKTLQSGLIRIQELLKDAAKGKNVIPISPNGRDLMRTPNDERVSLIVERDGVKVGEIGFKIVKNVIRLDFAEYDGGVLCKSETGS